MQLSRLSFGRATTLLIFSFVFLLTAILFFPAVANASTYSLYRYKETAGDSILLSQGTFDNMDNFLCSVQSMSCAKTTKATITSAYQVSDTDITRFFPSSSGTYTVVEKITKQNGVLKQYLLATSIDPAAPFSTLNISENIDQVIYANDTNTKAIFISTPGKDKQKLIIFYDLLKNSEIGRVATADNITRGVYSSDGTTFAYYVSLEANNTKTKKYVLLHLENGVIKNSTYSYTVEKEWDLLADAWRLHGFSNDGTVYAYIEDSNDFAKPRVISSLGEGFNGAIDVSWPDLGVVTDLVFSSNNTLLIVANSKSRPYDWSVYQINLATGTHEEVVKDFSLLYEIKKLASGKILVARTDQANLKPIIYDPSTKTTQNFSGLSWNTGTHTHTKTILSFPNKSHGVLITPTKTETPTKSMPLIVWLHGGPLRQAAKDFHSYPSYATYDWMLDEAVAGGAMVLKLDYPGSFGYGNAYAYSLLEKDGLVDSLSVIEDIRMVKQTMKLAGDVYVVGNSYGGYLAAKMITDYPKEIKEAISVNGVYEWRTLLNYLRTSIFNVHFDGLFDPQKTAFYDTASITKGIDHLTSKNKIVVAVSTEDKTINPDQAYTFVEPLKIKNKNVDQLLFIGDDHILKKEESNDLLCQKIFSDANLRVFPGACLLDKSRQIAKLIADIQALKDQISALNKH